VPSWGEILQELQATIPQPGAPPDFDGVRRKYLTVLYEQTKRPTILYSTDWLGGGPPEAAITLEDMQAMMEACRDLDGPNLDLILHSPGGSAEATASIVRYLRRKFDHIRVFVPVAAMSAATMWALAGNEIVMGKHSQLGPIDPQLLTPQGAIPARAILDQFDRAKKECSENPAVLGAWLPILQQYGPALIEQCENAEKLAKRLTTDWLTAYMFANADDAQRKAERIVEFFVDPSRAPVARAWDRSRPGAQAGRSDRQPGEEPGPTGRRAQRPPRCDTHFGRTRNQDRGEPPWPRVLQGCSGGAGTDAVPRPAPTARCPTTADGHVNAHKAPLGACHSRDISGTHFRDRARPGAQEVPITSQLPDAGGGTRTPDTRIMIPLL